MNSIDTRFPQTEHIESVFSNIVPVKNFDTVFENTFPVHSLPADLFKPATE